MESIIKDSPTKKRRKFDKAFKCEVVRNWLSSGKSAAVIAKEFGLNESLIFAWRKLLPPADAGGAIPLGRAVETGAGLLPYRAIIHVAGIKMLWRSSERAIRGCVRSAIAIARERGYRSIAFPLIGAGTGGFSPARALELMLDEARGIEFDGEVRIVRFRNAS